MTRTALNRGDYLMNKAADSLKEEGWIVEKAKKVRWQQQDFFGCWDIIAIHPKTKQILWVQVSSKPLYDRGKEYNNKLKEFPHVGDRQYWWYNKHREWRITNL